MKFRFTLRDWFWLVLVLALLMIWLLDRSRLSARVASQKEEISQLQLDVLRASSANLRETMNKMMRGYIRPNGGGDDASRTDGNPEDR